MILKLAAEFRPMVWGSENWVISGYGERETRVAEGPLAGKTLNEVYGEQFPLLIKFIDAHDDLSLQVHPDDALAAKRGIGLGKTEMWYVMNDGGHLLVGLKEKITPDSYAQLVRDNRLVDVLERHDTSKGDIFFLPAGRIHAICGGTVLCEIQETSDNTYRIYDYGRKDQDGNPRELHHKEAREVLDFTSLSDYRTHYTTQANKPSRLAACQYFSTEILDLSQTTELDVTPLDSFCILICVDGEAEVDQRDGLQPQTARLKKGHTLLLPANATNVMLTPLSSSKLLQVWVP